MARHDDVAKARSIFRNGDPDSAADILERLMEREPENVAAHLLLARCYSRMRLGEDAVSEVEEALSLEPENAEAHALRGAEHYFADELEEAAEELERAIELDADCVEAHVRLAQVRVDEKDFDEATESLEETEALAENDQDALALVRMGQVYLAMQRRDHSEALRIVEENEGLWAGHPYVEATVRSNQAVIYARQRHYDRARDLLTDVLELDPYFHTARSLLGQIAAIQRDNELAVDQLQQVVENDADVGAQVHYALAMSLAALGHDEEANPHYRAALGKGLAGFPALTAHLNVALPNRTVRTTVAVALLAVIAVAAFRLLAPLLAVAVVFGIGLLGRQLLRGGR